MTDANNAARGHFERNPGGSTINQYFTSGDQRSRPEEIHNHFHERARDSHPSQVSGASFLIPVLIAVVIIVLILGGIFAASFGRNAGCTELCWQTQKAIELGRQETVRAVGNSDANARVGMGTNDDVTKQTAVLPREKFEYRETAPNVLIERSVPVPVPQRPVVGGCGGRCGTVVPPCATRCGGGGVATPDGRGGCTLHGDGHAGERGVIGFDGRCRPYSGESFTPL